MRQSYKDMESVLIRGNDFSSDFVELSVLDGRSLPRCMSLLLHKADIVVHHEPLVAVHLPSNNLASDGELDISMDLEGWLRSLGLQQYQAIFREKGHAAARMNGAAWPSAFKNSPHRVCRNLLLVRGRSYFLRVVATTALRRIHVRTSAVRCHRQAIPLLCCKIIRVCGGIATSTASYRRVAACPGTLRHCQRGSAREEGGNNRGAFQGDHDDPPNADAHPTHFSVRRTPVWPQRFVAVHYKSP
jgi:hypothetical protein